MSRYIDADALIEKYYKQMDKLMESTSERLSAEALSLLCGFTLINSAPSIDIPQWTPCSERLPSEYGRYLVVYPLLTDKPWVSILWYGKPTFPEKDDPCFYASDDEYGDVEYSDVIAWMPLPEPWKGADDE